MIVTANKSCIDIIFQKKVNSGVSTVSIVIDAYKLYGAEIIH